jgi:hypothetical protein
MAAFWRFARAAGVARKTKRAAARQGNHPDQPRRYHLFFGGAGLFWSAHLYGMAGAQGGTAEPGSYGGWYFFV